MRVAASPCHRARVGAVRVTARARGRAPSAALETLDALIATSRRGAVANEATRRDVERAIDAMCARTTSSAGNNARSDGRWRLMYTTERETLFLLGTKERGTEAYQTIDVKNRTLKNEVVFNDGRAVFTVDASIEEVSETRMEFAFTSASLRFGDFTIPIPPFGKGWFENVYVDGERRISRDSRGDTLVCARDV